MRWEYLRIAKLRGRIAFSLALILAALIAPGAGATTTTVNCSGLQAALTAVHDGDTIILDGLCASGSYELPYSSTGGTFTGGFTLEGEPGTTSGFNGVGPQRTYSLLYGEVDSTSGTPTALENLTFENAVDSASNDPPGLIDGKYAALAVGVVSGPVTLDGDTFTGNSGTAYPAAVIQEQATSCNDSLTVENSTFSHNTYDGGGDYGGGLSLIPYCETGVTTVTHDQFTNNTMNVEHANGFGAGLYIWGPTTNSNVTQSDNVFDSNTITGSAGNDFGGGGEWAQQVNVHSTGDRFTNNTIPGTSGPSNWSWGAGFADVNCGSSTAFTGSALSDAVVASNTIADSGGDLPADAQGAGIYLGCSPEGSYNKLTLNDSTVSANQVTPAASGAVAGIDGGSDDQLTLNDSILYGDSGGSETNGFTATGSSLTATYSDFCNASAPDAGSGNICANPQLGGTDGVQETATSPTINAGSNSLVPSGLTTDFFGNARINTPTATCSVNTNVDIGAAQFGPVCHTTPAPPPPVTLTLTGVSQTRTKWRSGSAQATIARKHKHKRHKPNAPLGTKFSFTLSTQATVTLSFTRVLGGRTVGGRCVATTHTNRGKPVCSRRQAAGKLNFPNVVAGAHVVTFDGAPQTGKRLKPGAYSVAIEAATSAAAVAPQTLSFTIVKG